jgi:hypothetical protein
MVTGVGRDLCHCQHVHFTQVAVYPAVKPLACYIDSMSSIFLHGVLHKHRGNEVCQLCSHKTLMQAVFNNFHTSSSCVL